MVASLTIKEHVCKGARTLGDSEHPRQVTDVGVEGSASDMWVRVLSHDPC